MSGGTHEQQPARSSSGERAVPAGGAGPPGARAGAGRWRQPPLRPTRAPAGEVRWWERPAPENSEELLWQAVQRLQARRLQLGMTVTDLARRIERVGLSLRRETLSRVLNGKQPTTWETTRRLAEILGVDVDSPESPDDEGSR